jgi:hypothetical protein
LLAAKINIKDSGSPKKLKNSTSKMKTQKYHMKIDLLHKSNKKGASV